MDNRRKSYLGRINGAQISELFRQHKSGLFALNIRNYIGDTGTNRAIRKTATSAPYDFFYANNGICAVATRIRPDEGDDSGRTLLCDRFSIINGAQTVRSLAKAQSDNSTSVREVEALLRLVEYDSKITQGEQLFLDNIIRNNNTQNAIKVSDFRSNDQVQISLRQHFAKLPALKGKTYLYRNKRRGERDSLHHIVSMEEFTKSIHAFFIGPDDRFGGTSYLFNTDKDGGYLRLFGDDDGELRTALTSEEFHKFAGAWFLCEYVRGIWKERGPEFNSPGLERRWLIFWAVGESMRILASIAQTDLDKDMRKLSNPFWTDPSEPKGSHYRSVVEKHFRMSARAIKKIYTQDEKKEKFSHRNWFRYESTFGSIREELQGVMDSMADLDVGYKALSIT